MLFVARNTLNPILSRVSFRWSENGGAAYRLHESPRSCWDDVLQWHVSKCDCLFFSVAGFTDITFLFSHDPFSIIIFVI